MVLIFLLESVIVVVSIEQVKMNKGVPKGFFLEHFFCVIGKNCHSKMIMNVLGK